MIRALASLGATILLVALIGVGAVLARVGERWGAGAERGAAEAPEVRELRGRVAELRGMIDTIRLEETVLRDAAGLPHTDSAALVRRFFPRMPRVLGGGRRTKESPNTGPLPSISTDSGAIRAAAAAAGASADSLAAHAGAVLDKMRRLAASSRHRDSLLDHLVLRPESLSATLLAQGTAPSLTKRGTDLEIRPLRPTAVTLGVGAIITHAALDTSGLWRVEWSGPAAQRGTLIGPVRPLVRERERVAWDQLIVVVDPPRPGATRLLLRLQRGGVALDPTTGRPTK
jgi:hypothetical protein